jgi:hypothetical protein
MAVIPELAVVDAARVPATAPRPVSLAPLAARAASDDGIMIPRDPAARLDYSPGPLTLAAVNFVFPTNTEHEERTKNYR